MHTHHHPPHTPTHTHTHTHTHIYIYIFILYRWRLIRRNRRENYAKNIKDKPLENNKEKYDKKYTRCTYIWVMKNTSYCIFSRCLFMIMISNRHFHTHFLRSEIMHLDQDVTEMLICDPFYYQYAFIECLKLNQYLAGNIHQSVTYYVATLFSTTNMFAAI